ncbi:T9SS type A sorting domain-containing protein [Phaeodactylibacter xiamenensis]|uniref:T9SS type A sorting domain-containing protein n=1 Tax=Phaeodactylibacter xiamenensis TaxID=1524460 RepID=UPI003BA8B353
MKNRTTTLLLLLLSLPTLLMAQQRTFPAERSTAEFLGKSPALTELADFSRDRTGKAKLRKVIPKEIPNFTQRQHIPRNAAATALPKGADPRFEAQQLRSQNLMVEPSIVFEGIDRPASGGITPPDPCGDLNGKHYIQMANSSGGATLRVYDLEGNLTLNLPSLSALWAEFGVSGLGDPIVLWDHAAERWMISEFQDFGGNALLVAVSVTDDPAGEWYAYRFQTPSFPDYPKYSIWHNAYLVTTNEPSDDNVPIYALEREAMLQGATPGVQRLGIPKFPGGGFQVATPVDWDGNNPPPTDAPGYVVRMYDDAWDGGQDKVELWEVHLDWADDAANFVSGPSDMVGAPFDAEICPNGSFFDCIEQPNGQLVDGLKDIILHRVPYLNFGSHESILLHFAVDVDGMDRAGLRWMELRKNSNSDWSIYQEGTYSKDDGLSRFAGGISMDFNGNILMAYSVGGPTRELSLRYTGRLNGDPLGIMTVEEYEFAEGLSSQNGARWGDYAAMAIDPLTGTDFWFTGEYMGPDGLWSTKIMSAKLRRDSNDVGIQALTSPQSSGYLTDAEPVQVAVRNFGYKPMSGYTIGFQFENGMVFTDTIMDTLASDSVYLHTFAETVNMTPIDSYDFLLFTSHPLDTANFNDTLRVQVEQLPRNDVAIAEVLGLEQNICDTSALVEIVIQNAGVDTLFSAFISTGLNGMIGDDIEWEGSLAPGATETIVIELSPLNNGINEFAVSVGFPNEVNDENQTNDSREIQFEAVLDGQEVTVRLLTDSYPEETSWEIRDLMGNIIAEGGPYQEQITLEEAKFCLPDACYLFILYDSWGDGLIGPPAGDFEIVDGEGNILAQLGDDINFGTQTQRTFCATFNCLLSIDASILNESAPGAEDGSIILNLSNGLEEFEYSINGGDTFQSSPVFSNLIGGTYECVGRDINGCLADTLVTLATCALELSAEVTNATEGQPNGSILVNVSGGQGDLTYQIGNGSFQDSNLFEGLAPGNYTIRVRDGAGCEQSLLVTVEMTSSLSHTFFGKEVKLYPNPTDGFVQVEIRGLDNTNFLPVRIINSSGQTVRHARLVNYGEITRGIVSLYDLPAGTYFLRFEHVGLPRLFKVVKQ